MPSAPSKQSGKPKRPNLLPDPKGVDRRSPGSSMSRSTSPLLQTSLTSPAPINAALSDSPLEDLLDGISSGNVVPLAGPLKAVTDSIRENVLAVIRLRDEACDRMMRELARRVKERSSRLDVPAPAPSGSDRREKKKDALGLALTPKKRERPADDDRPPAVGAHGLTRQDGLGGDRKVKEQSPAEPPSAPNPRLSVDTSTAALNAGDSSTASPTSPRQPEPAASVLQVQLFGEDPSKYPDPTIYHIRDITEDMPEDEKKAILCVASYPPSDLTHLHAGPIPDKDFSNAKPTNQVAANTFANAVEPYVRPLTDEDRSFLLERGDRIGIFEIPKRGPRHYREVWAEEDGLSYTEQDRLANRLPTNEARGGIDDMNDDVAESERVSAGPILSRLIQLLDDEPLEPDEPMKDETDALAGAGENSSQATTTNVGTTETPTAAREAIPPATAMPEKVWKNTAQPGASGAPPAPPAPSRHDYVTDDERVLQELRHIGFLSETDVPNFAGDVADDEVTARLRYLQAELRRVSLINGARKRRLLELTADRMAVQEWTTIADDIDNQLIQAYLKRSRNFGKGKKGQVKRPGAAGPSGAGVARPGQAGSAGLGEPLKSLMEKKREWRELIGPVVNYGKVPIPEGTIFDKENMERHLAMEQEHWLGETE